jgi:hypothetical protein
MKKFQPILLIILCVSAKLFSQQSEPQRQDSTRVNFEFTLKDGTKLIGQLIDQNKEGYIIKTANLGIIKLPLNQVVSVILQGEKPIVKNKEDNPTSYFTNQFGFKYFLVNTGIPVEPKKLFYTNQYVFFSTFSYGFNKYVSGGVSFFTFVPTSYFSPNLKITINPDSKTKFAINGQYYATRGSNFGLVQGLLTSGNSQTNFTFGYSKILSGKGSDEGSIVTFAFVKKVSPKLSVISENNIIIPSIQTSSNSISSSGNTIGFLSAGLRFDRRMHAFDLGVWIPTSGLDREVYTIPYLGFHVKLNR